MRRRLSPFRLGLLEWLAAVTLFAASLAVGFKHVAYPSPELMRSAAEIAATLFVAWIVQAVWMTARLERTGDDRENWLGGATGLGVAGFMGIVISLLVAAHLEAGHRGFFDRFGLWWAAIALGALGLMVALHPVIVERWTSDQADD